MSEYFAATLNKGVCFIDLQVLLNELVCCTGACGRDRREEEELVDMVDMVDMEWWIDEHNSGAFY